MSDENEIRAVMANTDCSRGTAIQALEWANHRVTAAIRRVMVLLNNPGPLWLLW